MRDHCEVAEHTVQRMIHRFGINMTLKQQEQVIALLWNEFDEVHEEAVHECAQAALEQS